MSKEAKRVRVDDIKKCETLASVGEYLEDNPFISYGVQKILSVAIDKIFNHNFTQYQLYLQSIEASSRAYKVLLRIMEIRFGLERIE